MSTATVLAAENLSKRFGATQALDRASLALASGEVVAIAGENGAGKSTLIRIFAGVHRPDSGTLAVNGRPLALESPGDAIAAGIVMIPQELRVVPALSVAENVMLGRLPTMRLFGVLPRRDEAALLAGAKAALELLGVVLPLGAPVRELGFAERQLVSIARALTRQAQVLILDEPTASLEDREVERLFATIARLKAQGVAIVYITHRLAEIAAVADRCLVMRDGRVVAEYPRAQCDPARIAQDMTGRALDAIHARHDRAIGAERVAAEIGGATVAGRSGEVVALAGLLGSGAGGVLHRLFGAAPSPGTMRLAGAPHAPAGPRDAIGAGIGFVPGERALGLVMALSVRDNIVLPHLARFVGAFGRNEKAIDAAATRLAELLDIRPRDPRRPVRQLSGGNQQKVIFAKWLAGKLDLLLLDEPTQGIDIGAKAQIHKLAQEFVRDGGTIVMTSSDMPETLALGDMVYAMREGRVTGRLDRAGEFTEARLRAMLAER